MYIIYYSMIKTAIINFICIVFVTIFLHWFLVSLYTHICVPSGIKGIYYTFMNLGSPVCYFINKIQYELAKNYITIWTAAGVGIVAWLISKLKL